MLGPDVRSFAFWKGRVALYAILQALGVGAGDEVLIAGFTCVVVPNAVRFLGAKPVYADISIGSYNLDPASAAQAITPLTRAMIVQHTLGIPAPLEELLALAKLHNLAVIEDCAHSLGSTYCGNPLGTFGNAAFLAPSGQNHTRQEWAALPSPAIATWRFDLREYSKRLPSPASVRSGAFRSNINFTNGSSCRSSIGWARSIAPSRAHGIGGLFVQRCSSPAAGLMITNGGWRARSALPACVNLRACRLASDTAGCSAARYDAGLRGRRLADRDARRGNSSAPLPGYGAEQARTSARRATRTRRAWQLV